MSDAVATGNEKSAGICVEDDAPLTLCYFACRNCYFLATPPSLASAPSSLFSIV